MHSPRRHGFLWYFLWALLLCAAAAALYLLPRMTTPSAPPDEVAPPPAGTPASLETPPEQAPEPEPEPAPEPAPEPEDTSYSYTLAFAGDISLADGARTTARLQSAGGDVSACIDSALLDRMRAADLLCINSEFAFTTGGVQQEKNYTFRGDPARISIYADLGVNLAVLANNHVFDYGEQGLLDTLSTFQNAALPYIGAGADLDEASAIYYWRQPHCTVAFVAGCRVEWNAQTRGAGDALPGVFRTAESNDLLCQRVREAKENADFVVVYMHWGMEGTTDLESYQTATAAQLSAAGADAVIGDHPHVLQGLALQGATPVFYSLGNFWFSGSTVDTMLLEVTLTGDASGISDVQYRIVPARQVNAGVEAYSAPESQRAIFDRLEALSPGVTIDDTGRVTFS